jgi:Icc protein
MSNVRKTVRLLHVTDPHLFAQPGKELRGVDTHASLLSVVAAAKAEQEQIDAIVATGDLVQDESRDGYLHFRSILESFDVPVYCLPGNHDAPLHMREVLDGGNFQYCGVAVFDAWCIPMLDTYWQGHASGKLAEEALAGLEATLAEFVSKYALIALHHQPIPMGSRWLDRVGLSNAGRLADIVERHHNVRGLLWGHVHQASDRGHGRIRLMSTPSTCAQFLPDSDEFAVDSRPPAYRRLELHPDGRISTRVVWLQD